MFTHARSRSASTIAVAVVVLISLTVKISAQVPLDQTLTKDPVELIVGREVDGKPELTIERDGIAYRFATTENKAAFEKAPEKYEVVDGGACGRMGPLSGLGDASRFAVHDSRIYFFASEGCRTGFLKDPAACIERPDPKPAATAESVQKGMAAMDRLLSWAGGEAAWRTLKSYSHTVSSVQKSGEKDWKVTKSFAAVFPDRFVVKEEWDNLWYSTIRSTDGAAMASSSRHDVINASRRDAVDRLLARSLVVLLNAYAAGKRPDAAVSREVVVVYHTAEKVGDDDVDTIDVWMSGAASRLSIDQKSGRPVRLAFRGRDTTSSIGDVIRTFTESNSVDGVQLPTAYTVTFDGKDLPSAGWKVESFSVNQDLPASWFEVLRK